MMKKQETGLADGTSERANFGGLARYIVGTSSSRAHQSQKTSSQAAKIKKKDFPIIITWPERVSSNERHYTSDHRT